MEEVREYFKKNYGHIDLGSISDQEIKEYLDRIYLEGLSFEQKMDCYCDYLMANQLVDYTE